MGLRKISHLLSKKSHLFSIEQLFDFPKANPFLEGSLELFEHDEVLINGFLQSSLILQNFVSAACFGNYTKHTKKLVCLTIGRFTFCIVLVDFL